MIRFRTAGKALALSVGIVLAAAVQVASAQAQPTDRPVLVSGAVHPAAAPAAKVAWPVDVTNGTWEITNGYYGDGSDHGCKNVTG